VIWLHRNEVANACFCDWKSICMHIPTYIGIHSIDQHLVLSTNQNLFTIFRVPMLQTAKKMILLYNFCIMDSKFFAIVQSFSKYALAAWSTYVHCGNVSACHRRDWSYGSWDRIPPGKYVVWYLIKVFYIYFCGQCLYFSFFKHTSNVY
jgi:hypothetical protein